MRRAGGPRRRQPEGPGAAGALLENACVLCFGAQQSLRGGGRVLGPGAAELASERWIRRRPCVQPARLLVDRTARRRLRRLPVAVEPEPVSGSRCSEHGQQFPSDDRHAGLHDPHRRLRCSGVAVETTLR